MSATQAGSVEVYNWRKGRLMLGSMRGELALLELDAGRERLRRQLDYYRIGLIGLESGRILRWLAGHTAPIQALAFVDEGRGLISTGNDARLLVWKLGEPEREEGS